MICIPRLGENNTGGYMAHYGTLKDAPIADAGEEVRGSHLYDWHDEKLGKIDDVFLIILPVIFIM